MRTIFLACYAPHAVKGLIGGSDREGAVNSLLKKAPLTGVHPTAKHIATKAVLPSSETMRTI